MVRENSDSFNIIINLILEDNKMPQETTYSRIESLIKELSNIWLHGDNSPEFDADIKKTVKELTNIKKYF